MSAQPPSLLPPVAPPSPPGTPPPDSVLQFNLLFPVSVRGTQKARKKLAEAEAESRGTFSANPIDPSSDWGVVHVPASHYQQALRSFGKVTGGHFKYSNTHVTFRHQGRRVAKAMLGIQDDTWAGPIIPFGAPVLTSGVFQRKVFGNAAVVESVSLCDTSFDCCRCAQGVYYCFNISIDLHLQGDAPRPLLEQQLRPAVVPYETKGWGTEHGRCVATDLVIFLLITRPALASAQNNSVGDVVGGCGDGEDVEVLLVLEKSRRWFVPAGHVERDQSFTDAAAMELLEESGYSLDRSAPVVPFDIVYGSQGYDGYGPETACVHILYTGKINEGVKQIDAVDGLGTTWVKLAWLLRALALKGDAQVAFIAAGLPNWGDESKTKPAPFRKPWEMWEVVGRFAKQYAPQAYQSIYVPEGAGVESETASKDGNKPKGSASK